MSNEQKSLMASTIGQLFLHCNGKLYFMLIVKSAHSRKTANLT